LLRRRGQLSDALDSLRRGLALGSRDPKWRYTAAAARWVQECEYLVPFERQLPPILAGEAAPAGAHEAIGFAQGRARKGRHAAAARLYEGAFALAPELAANLQAGHRYQAARSAALAVATLEEAGRARWRRQALDWLRADLAAWVELLKGPDPQARAR